MPDTQNPPVSPVRTLALDDLPSGFGPSAVAVGNFDGVHRGHAALIQTAIAEARRQDARAIVLTFEPHPRTFFRPERPVFRMTPPAAKARIMAALGIDAMVAARDNVEERLQDLTAQARLLRQEQITEEVIELAAGSTA